MNVSYSRSVKLDWVGHGRVLTVKMASNGEKYILFKPNDATRYETENS
jgi:hypothetical protein